MAGCLEVRFEHPIGCLMWDYVGFKPGKLLVSLEKQLKTQFGD